MSLIRKIPFDIKKNLLLTGAGFTANFNGFLSREIGLRIFNYLPTHSKVRSLLLENPSNFETIYYEVLVEKSQDFMEQERENFKKAVMATYIDLDRIVCQFGYRGRSGYGLFYGNFSRFVAGSFAGNNSSERGAIFTLNQDLFLERVHGFKAPMFHEFAFQLQNNYQILERTAFTRMPNKTEMEEKINKYVQERFTSDGDFFYFKLHGSYGWLTSDGSDLMVLGGFKEKQIEEEPLLKWYYGCFKEILFRDRIKILIIGYSFNDSHINQIIKEAIDDFGLKFCILTPGNHINTQLAQISAYKLNNGLYKAFPYSLSQLFPEDQSPSPYLREILEVFPNNRVRISLDIEKNGLTKNNYVPKRNAK